MAQGISPNPLNDISKAYLELVAKINKDEEEKVIEKWDDSSVNKVDPDLVLKVEDKQYGYDTKGRSLNPVDIEKRKRKDDDLFGSPKKKAKIKTQESFSDWRDDLREIVSEPEEKAEKEVKEKKGIKNKVVINPKLGEAVQEMGGQLLQIQEIVADEDPGLKAKENRQKMIKKQVLLKKLQAVRAGAQDIAASYNLIDAATDYLYEEGLNEEGIDLLIEEIGLDGFVEFIEGPIVELNEAEEGRPAKKASVRAKKYDVVKKEVDKADAARKASKKGEYAPSYAKKETDVTVYDDDKPAAKKKATPAKKPAAPKKAATPKKPAAPKKPAVKKAAPKTKGGAIVKAKSSAIVKRAVTKAKVKQPVKKTTKQGLRDKIATAYKKGVERHKASVGKAKTEVGKVVKTAKATAKQHSKHRKDFVKGISPTAKEKKIAKGVGGAVKKALTREELELLEKVKGEDTQRRKDAAAERRSGEVGGVKTPKRLAPSKGRQYVKGTKASIDWWAKKTRKEEVVVEKDLNAAERRALPDKDFALPGKGKGPEGKQAGSYPIPDKTHARMALAMVAKHGTSEKKAKVRAAVAKKFPGIKQEEVQLEAKVDTGSAEAKASARNVRNTPPGKDSKFDTSVFITRKPGESLDSARTRKRREAHAKKRGVKEDKAFDNVVAALRKKHGEGSVLTKDSPKPKPQPKAKPKAQKPLTDKEKAHREVIARYGGEANYKAGRGLGT